MEARGLLGAAVALVLLAQVYAHRVKTQVRDGELSYPVAGRPNAKSMLITCTISRHQDDVPYQAVLDLTKPRSVHHNKEIFKRCMSAGRGDHRSSMLLVPANLPRSLDWGVTLKVLGKYTDGKVNIRAENHRREAVRLKIITTATNTVASHASPLVVDIPPRAAKIALKLKRFKQNVPWAPDFAWKAEPAVYVQEPNVQTLYSNGVFLVLHNRRTETAFYVYNNRNDIDAPIFLSLDVLPAEGTSKGNLAFKTPDGRNVAPLSARIPPGKKRLILTASAVDVKKPWAFTFDYRWQSGVSPRELFGTK